MTRAQFVGSCVLVATVIVAAPLLAHHDGFGELPEHNPHRGMAPQEVWDLGGEGLEINGFPVVLDKEPLDFPRHYWFLLRIGGDDDHIIAVRLEGGVGVGDVILDPQDDFLAPIVVDESPEGAPIFDYVLAHDWGFTPIYPHTHAIHLHVEYGEDGRRSWRCAALDGGEPLNTPNQHGAVHHGRAGHYTPGGVANGGHEIHMHWIGCPESDLPGDH